MYVERNSFSAWLSNCVSTVSNFFARIKTAVLRAFGFLEDDVKISKPITASKGDSNSTIDAVRNKYISPTSPQASPEFDSKSPPPPPSNQGSPAISSKSDAPKQPSLMQFSKDQEKGLQNPDLPPEYDDPNIDTKFEPITDAHLKRTEHITGKDQKEHERDPIIETSMNVKQFGEVRYSINIESRFDLNRNDQKRIEERQQFNAKYKTRIVQISSFFGAENVYPVRGDGNCFCNSVVVGLLNLIIKNPSKANEIRAVLEGLRKSSLPYVKPDNSTQAYEYSKNFTKNNDFDEVLKKLEKGISKESFNDFDFAAKFSRVIRYALLVHAENDPSFEFPKKTGKEIEIFGILAINSIFNLNAKVVVLENKMVTKNQDLSVDPKDPQEFSVISGTDLYSTPQKLVNSARDKKQTADFLVVHRAGHYFAMV